MTSQGLTLTDLNLLLIEPSEVQQKIITRSLAEIGISKLEICQNLASARLALARFMPDLVVSAMYLEDGQANDFLLELRHNNDTAELPFMLISSERNKAYLEQMKQSGVLAILPKPFSGQDLQRAVNATLDVLHAHVLEHDDFEMADLRILLVDDSRLARKHIRRVIETMGGEQIVEAENGREAVALIEQQTFDIIITDYNMPEMDGRELTEYVRQHANYAHIPVLMVSSEANEQHLANISQAGVDAICDKPFEPAVVRQLLARMLQ